MTPKHFKDSHKGTAASVVSTNQTFKTLVLKNTSVCLATKFDRHRDGNSKKKSSLPNSTIHICKSATYGARNTAALLLES